MDLETQIMLVCTITNAFQLVLCVVLLLDSLGEIFSGLDTLDLAP